MRENWVRTIVQAVDYGADFLRKQLARQQRVSRDMIGAVSGSGAGDRRRR